MSLSPDLRSPGNLVLWILGTLALACVARLGWEMGGVLWGAF